MKRKQDHNGTSAELVQDQWETYTEFSQFASIVVLKIKMDMRGNSCSQDR